MIFQQWMLWAFEIELLSSHSSTLTFLFYSCKNAWRLIRKHETLQSTFYQIKGERDTGNSQPLNGEWLTLWWREFGRETRTLNTDTEWIILKMTDALIEHNKKEKKYKFSKGTHGFKRYHTVRVSENLSTTAVNLRCLTYFYACQGQV